MVLDKKYRAYYHRRGTSTRTPSFKDIKAGNQNLALSRIKKELGKNYVIEKVLRWD